jgi:TPR repeat protein
MLFTPALIRAPVHASWLVWKLPKDDREAARLYKLAAHQGNAYGQYNLGRMYEYGRGGLPKDDREAVRFFRLAAGQGNEIARRNLANYGRQPPPFTQTLPWPQTRQPN